MAVRPSRNSRLPSTRMSEVGAGTLVGFIGSFRLTPPRGLSVELLAGTTHLMRATVRNAPSSIPSYRPDEGSSPQGARIHDQGAFRVRVDAQPCGLWHSPHPRHPDAASCADNRWTLGTIRGSARRHLSPIDAPAREYIDCPIVQLRN